MSWEDCTDICYDGAYDFFWLHENVCCECDQKDPVNDGEMRCQLKVTDQWYIPEPSKVHTYAAFQMENSLMMSNEPPTMFPDE